MFQDISSGMKKRSNFKCIYMMRGLGIREVHIPCAALQINSNISQESSAERFAHVYHITLCPRIVQYLKKNEKF
jgi:hypothetical protein